MTLALMAVRQEVNNFASSVVVQELEFAMNLALYGLRCEARNSWLKPDDCLWLDPPWFN